MALSSSRCESPAWVSQLQQQAVQSTPRQGKRSALCFLQPSTAHRARREAGPLAQRRSTNKPQRECDVLLNTAPGAAEESLRPSAPLPEESCGGQEHREATAAAQLSSVCSPHTARLCQLWNTWMDLLGKAGCASGELECRQAGAGVTAVQTALAPAAATTCCGSSLPCPWAEVHLGRELLAKHVQFT